MHKNAEREFDRQAGGLLARVAFWGIIGLLLVGVVGFHVASCRYNRSHPLVVKQVAGEAR